VVTGPQTAVVVGPKGEEIYTDEHGCVKVRFHWDRYAKGDEHSSCWIRVAQLWAGTRFGAMFLPRIGHEVVVEFLDGDPDQPLITGRVYNAANRTPYPLPAKKTVSTIKSRSRTPPKRRSWRRRGAKFRLWGLPAWPRRPFWRPGCPFRGGGRPVFRPPGIMQAHFSCPTSTSASCCRPSPRG
jgi:hypothetical protein